MWCLASWRSLTGAPIIWFYKGNIIKWILYWPILDTGGANFHRRLPSVTRCSPKIARTKQPGYSSASVWFRRIWLISFRLRRRALLNSWSKKRIPIGSRGLGLRLKARQMPILYSGHLIQEGSIQVFKGQERVQHRGLVQETIVCCERAEWWQREGFQPHLMVEF